MIYLHQTEIISNTSRN